MLCVVGAMLAQSTFARWETPDTSISPHLLQTSEEAQREAVNSTGKKEIIWTYNHIPKTGGTAMKYLAPQVFLDKYIIRNEFETFDDSDFEDNHFRVASIRSPCDYYRSLWTFGSEGHGAFKGHLRKSGYDLNEYYGQTPPFDGPEDLAKFDKWLRLANGTYTHRVRQSIKVNRREEIGDVQDHVHCWIRTESYYPDMQKCLHKFEKMGGKVDWVKFRKAVGETFNESAHDKCGAYFNEERSELVSCMDPEIFKWFNFDVSSCCAGASTQKAMRSQIEANELDLKQTCA